MLKKYSFKKLIFLITIILITNTIIFHNYRVPSENILLNYTFNSDTAGVLQVFYANEVDELQWNEENSQKVNYDKLNTQQDVFFEIPSSTKFIRLDFYNQSNDIIISNLYLTYRGEKIPLEQNSLTNSDNMNQITDMKAVNNSYIFSTTDADPYIKYQISDSIKASLLQQDNNYNLIMKIILCLIVNILYLICSTKIEHVTIFSKDIYPNKRLIWNLSKNDFKTKYAGSYLGITWAFIQPIVTVLTYWFVFEYGLRAGSPYSDVPFVLWFVAGLVPWFFIQEALINSTSCMIEYSYLVKKIVFNINILPIVKIISSFFIHLVFVGFTITIFLFNKRFSGIYNLQLLYYSLCCFIFVLGISYATSSIIVFFKDLGQFITIALQILMWMTPIMWSKTILPSNLNWFPFFNPIFYIVDGYRDSLITNIWFWEKPLQTIYFWSISLILFLIGSIIFKKLKPHFADVL